MIQTSRPSPAALRKELVLLGNPVGVLPDGTPLVAAWGNALRWQRGDLIIDLHDMIGRMPRERLQDLAEDVVVM